MALFLELTSSGGSGVPAVDVKVTINPMQIAKFWPDGTGTKIFLKGLSTQEEEVNVNENYDHVKQQLGGVNFNS